MILTVLVCVALHVCVNGHNVIVLCTGLDAAENITCHCTIGFQNGCDPNSNTCELDEGDGACVTYYHQNTTIVQYCTRSALIIRQCQSKDGAYGVFGTRSICCFESYCNSQEALRYLYTTPGPSQNLTTPSTVSSTSSESVQTLPSASSSQPSSQPSTQSSSQPSSTEHHASSDSSPPVYAIALSVVLPLIIIAVFVIAIVMFLLYMRLYMKHKREKPSSESEFSQMY